MTLSEVPQKAFRNLMIGIMSIILLFTISRYFTSLSQYATADQMQFSMDFTRKFLDHPMSIDVTKQYHVTYLFSIPGRYLEKILKSNYSDQEHIIGNIFYTEVLPFQFTHLLVLLIALFYCVYLMCNLLDISLKKDYISFAFISILFLSYPTLIGISKVYTYDSFSVAFAIIAILNFILYIKNNQQKTLIISIVFCTLAYIEKVTAFSVIFLILFFQLINISLKQGQDFEIIKRIGKFIGLFLFIFIGATYVMIPSLWFDPLKITEILQFFFGWFFNFMDISTMFIFIFLIIIGWLFIRWGVSYKNKVITYLNKFSLNKLLIGLTLFGIILFTLSLLIQSSAQVDMTNADPILVNKIKSDGYFISSAEMASSSVSTMNKSAWITRLKILFDNIRLFFYVTPEIIIFCILLTPIFLYLLIKKRILTYSKKLIFLFSVFPFLLIISYSLLIAPVYARYNILPYIFIILTMVYSIYFYLKSLKSSHTKYSIILLISCLTIPSSIMASPSYFTYMNSFRNKTVENTEFLDFNKGTWSYVGWGESSLPCFNYILQTSTKPTKVLYDYAAPFHLDKKIIPFYSAQCRNRYMQFGQPQLTDMLTQIDNAGVEFIVVTKIVAYRSAINNYIIAKYKNKAIYVDRNCGIEYGWVFRTKDLLNAEKP